MSEVLRIRGAREHNLKSIDLDLPKNRLIVITGISGSGKSSLAFDTLFAEGQRRYVESLSAYARQFLGMMRKPDVDLIEGLSPAIAIQQKSLSSNPRSTVGTVTEIHDYLRLLYARLGIAHCPNCGTELSAWSIQQIVEDVLHRFGGQLVAILAPLVRQRKGDYRSFLEALYREGFKRVRVDGELIRLTEEPAPLARYKKHDIDLLVDRMEVRPEERTRLAQAVELAVERADGLVVAAAFQGDRRSLGEEHLYSTRFSCPQCGFAYREISPRLFSFNSPFGACPTCSGIGEVHTVVEEALYDPDASLMEGGIRPIAKGILDRYYFHAVRSLLEEYGLDAWTPLGELPRKVLREIFYGRSEKLHIRWRRRGRVVREMEVDWNGIIPAIQRRYSKTRTDWIREEIQKYLRLRVCPDCGGARLRREALSVTVQGKNIAEVSAMTVREAYDFLGKVTYPPHLEAVARPILKELRSRLEFLMEVGLEYLTLDRKAGTLAGGEAQRIRLATQIGTQLTGVLYVLDEPTIGLHPRDNARLIRILRRLRDLGNTVLVVEHDEQTIRSADFVVDLGPGAGKEGGRVIYAGPPEGLREAEGSLTGRYLFGEARMPLPKRRRPFRKPYLEIRKARKHNLKEITVRIPRGMFICLTGVSGSGKSSLMEEVLYEGWRLHQAELPIPKSLCDGFRNWNTFQRVVWVDQAPIGRTPRSNPATYAKVFDEIRRVFAQTEEARLRGYEPGRFSFNVPGGRCDHCEGVGQIQVEMHFLPDVYVPCPVCEGKRYNEETLQVRYRGKNIADVLAMTVEEALDFFAHHPKIVRILECLRDVGLGYITLGQPATTLSGGEAQRIKLAAELWKGGEETLYLLDEPTTGLHLADVEKLIAVLDRLVEKGNTVFVIEHHLDVIAHADWVIDLGPEGGEAGGYVVAEGPPEELARRAERGDLPNGWISWTGRALAEYFRKRSGARRERLPQKA